MEKWNHPLGSYWWLPMWLSPLLFLIVTFPMFNHLKMACSQWFVWLNAGYIWFYLVIHPNSIPIHPIFGDFGQRLPGDLDRNGWNSAAHLPGLRNRRKHRNRHRSHRLLQGGGTGGNRASWGKIMLQDCYSSCPLPVFEIVICYIILYNS